MTRRLISNWLAETCIYPWKSWDTTKLLVKITDTDTKFSFWHVRDISSFVTNYPKFSLKIRECQSRYIYEDNKRQGTVTKYSFPDKIWWACGVVMFDGVLQYL